MGNFWPSVKESAWWLLIGSIYGLLSLIPLVNENIRETLWSSLQDIGGPILVGAVLGLLPAIWATILTSPLPHTRNLLYVVAPLAAILGSTVAYLVKALFSAWKRRH